MIIRNHHISSRSIRSYRPRISCHWCRYRGNLCRTIIFCYSGDLVFSCSRSEEYCLPNICAICRGGISIECDSAWCSSLRKPFIYVLTSGVYIDNELTCCIWDYSPISIDCSHSCSSRILNNKARLSCTCTWYNSDFGRIICSIGRWSSCIKLDLIISCSRALRYSVVYYDLPKLPEPSSCRSRYVMRSSCKRLIPYCIGYLGWCRNIIYTPCLHSKAIEPICSIYRVDRSGYIHRVALTYLKSISKRGIYSYKIHSCS